MTTLQTQSFPTSLEAIHQRIDQIKPEAYGRTRNFIDGAVTGLSPYLSRGVISLPQVYTKLRQKGYRDFQMEKLVQEFAWREYFQRVWQAKGDALFSDLRQPQPDVLHHQLPRAVENASTGIEALDAGIRQLYDTGYLHNHMRMYLASLTCNLAKSHWLVPAQWMYYHLLDGDPASNHCSWQWVAGAFSSKKYYCNQENINRYTYTEQRGTFLDHPYETLPELPVPDRLKETVARSLQTELPETPVPVLDPSLPLLIYNSYTLDPQWRSAARANRILLLEPAHFRKFPVSKKVLGFILELARNIPGIQVYTGEVSDLLQLLPDQGKNMDMISKEHPAFTHYPGQQDPRDWLYPQVSGYFPSFSGFWKQCGKKGIIRPGDPR